MASIATMKGGAKTAEAGEAPRQKRSGWKPDNDRTETAGRFALVVMMPVIVAAMVAVIAFYLTLPLR